MCIPAALAHKHGGVAGMPSHSYAIHTRGFCDVHNGYAEAGGEMPQRRASSLVVVSAAEHSVSCPLVR